MRRLKLRHPPKHQTSLLSGPPRDQPGSSHGVEEGARIHETPFPHVSTLKGGSEVAGVLPERPIKATVEIEHSSDSEPSQTVPELPQPSQ